MTTKTQQQAHIDNLLLRITGLVRARNLLQQRDANEAELEENSAELNRLHWQLARIVQANHTLDRAA